MSIQAAALVVSIIGAGASIQQSRKSQQLAEKGEKLSNAQRAIENQKRIKATVARAREDRASQLAAGFASGAQGSSGLAGGLGSARTQVAANVGFAQQQAASNAQANRFFASSNQSLNRSRTFAALGQLPTQFGLPPGDAFQQIQEKRKANA